MEDAFTLRGTGLALRRLVRRKLWSVLQVLLVVITTVFFLMQSHCRMSLFVGESPSSVCSFMAASLKGVRSSADAAVGPSQFR
jgi:hypothetical protein